jgi:hypothetical protein
MKPEKTVIYQYENIEALNKFLAAIVCPICETEHGNIEAIQGGKDGLTFFSECENNHVWALFVDNMPYTIQMILKPNFEQMLGCSDN